MLYYLFDLVFSSPCFSSPSELFWSLGIVIILFNFYTNLFLWFTQLFSSETTGSKWNKLGCNYYWDYVLKICWMTKMAKNRTMGHKMPVLSFIWKSVMNKINQTWSKMFRMLSFTSCKYTAKLSRQLLMEVINP